MSCKENCKLLGHIMRVLELQEMSGPRQDESLGIREPLEQQPVGLPETGPQSVTLSAKHREDRLGDATCLSLAEAPTQLRREILFEPGRAIIYRLVERSG